ncbi:MAG: dimethyl sulfoxide reductase subunit B, partial [Eggerthellaceae bacterium]|nr:dimethyl sulfoxide reductase subunit B [Eggerthellaceae bacterium]
MTQYAFYFDGSRCTGCKTCEFACKDYYDLDTDVQYRKIYECVGGQTTRDDNGYFKTDAYAYYVSMSCNH